MGKIIVQDPKVHVLCINNLRRVAQVVEDIIGVIDEPEDIVGVIEVCS